MLLLSLLVLAAAGVPAVAGVLPAARTLAVVDVHACTVCLLLLLMIMQMMLASLTFMLVSLLLLLMTKQS
jgi:hypothetical protein